MDQKNVSVLYIDIHENRLGYRQVVYREGKKIIARRLVPPGVVDFPRIDLSKYKKKIYTLFAEGQKPIKSAIIHP